MAKLINYIINIRRKAVFLNMGRLTEKFNHTVDRLKEQRQSLRNKTVLRELQMYTPMQSIVRFLNNPDTLSELTALSKLQENPPFRNVSITDTGDTKRVVSFTEPTINTGTKKKPKYRYGTSMIIKYENNKVVGIDTFEREGHSHVSWEMSSEVAVASRLDIVQGWLVDVKRWPTRDTLHTFVKRDENKILDVVLSFFDYIGSRETKLYKRSTPHANGLKRPELLARRGVYDRAQFLADLLKKAPEAAGVLAAITKPRTANILAVMGMATVPESQLTKSFLAGVVEGDIVKYLTGCSNPSGEPIDLTEGVGNTIKKNIPSGIVPVESPDAYSSAILNQIYDTQPNDSLYNRLGFTDSRMYQIWVEKTRLNQVTGNVLSWMRQGSVEGRAPGAWQPILDTAGNSVENQLLIDHISNYGITGDAKILGYYNLNQSRNSNIIRLGIVVEYNGTQYVLKIQPYDAALREISSINVLKRMNPDIKTADITVFKLNTSPKSKLSITVSKAITNLEGNQIAPNIKNIIDTGQTLNEIQLGQIKQIYQAMIRSYFDTDANSKLGADVLNAENIVVNSNGDLVVIDGFSQSSSLSSSQATRIVDGKIVVTDVDPMQHLSDARDILKGLGISKDEILRLEGEVIDKTGWQKLQPGTSLEVNVNDPVAGEVRALGKITNDTEGAIVLPKNVPLPLWVKIFGVALDVGFAAWVADNVYKFMTPFADIEYTIQTPADDFARRGMSEEEYINLISGPLNEPSKSILLAHSLNSIPISSVQSDVDNFATIQNFRVATFLPTYKSMPEQIYARQLSMTHPGEYFVPKSNRLLAWIDPAGWANQFSVFFKQLAISDGEDGLTNVYSIPRRVFFEDIASRDIATQRSKAINFDGYISNMVRGVLDGGIKSTELFDVIDAAVENGEIDFCTATEDGRIAFGYLTSEAIEIRYLATRDYSLGYESLRSVTLNELLNSNV